MSKDVIDGKSYRELAIETNMRLENTQQTLDSVVAKLNDVHKCLYGNGVPGLDEKQRVTDGKVELIAKDIEKVKTDIDNKTRWVIGLVLSVLGVLGVNLADLVWRLVTHQSTIVQVINGTPKP